MKITIKNRWTGATIYKHEAERNTLRLTVEKAIMEGVSLRDADLQGADLSCAYLRSADLRSADLQNANLNAASLRAANLSGADLNGADLNDANLSGADLRSADLQGADLRDADLRGVNLSGADLSGADFSDVQEDIYRILRHAVPEVPGLIAALKEGRVDGSCYIGACACLLGTIANLRGCGYTQLAEIDPNFDSPAERWFAAIRKCDTPANNPVSAITVEWCEEFLAQQGAV